MERRRVNAQFREGDPDAVRAVYQEYGRLVFAVASRILRDRGLAEEATQHTFFKAWRAAGSFDVDRELGPWLTSIARRGAIDVSRREAVPVADSLDSVAPGDPALATRNESPEAIYDVWAMRDAVAGLQAEEREIVRLEHFGGLTHGEISEKLDMPIGVVKSRSFRADKRLAAALGHDVGMLAPEARPELDELHHLLDDASVWVEPPPELEDRIVTAIADEARATPPDQVPAAAPAPAVQPRAAQTTRLGQPVHAVRRAQVARPERQRQRQAHRPERRFPSILLERPGYMGGALAGLVAVIALVTFFTARGGDNTGPSQLRFAMAVSGTALAPGAHGSATLVKQSSGWRVTLKASGLPHLDNGRYYQAWLKDPAGIVVPIGTFNDPVDVTLWSGVPVTRFQTLTVTREQASGNPASSGQRVLIGTIQKSG